MVITSQLHIEMGTERSWRCSRVVRSRAEITLQLHYLPSTSNAVLQRLILIPTVFSASLQETCQLSVCLVTNPVVSFILGGRTRGEGASLSEMCISMSRSSYPWLNLHLACMLQWDLKNNPEFRSKQLEVCKKRTCILKVPLPVCNRSLRNLTCFLCQSLKLDLMNHHTAISQAMHLFQWTTGYRCNNSFWLRCSISEC